MTLNEAKISQHTNRNSLTIELKIDSLHYNKIKSFCMGKLIVLSACNRGKERLKIK